MRLGRRRARQAVGEARRRVRRPRPAPPAPEQPPGTPAPPAPVDPFTDPLEAVRAAAATHPDHPVWALVDRPRAETLLAARPEDLDWMSRAYVWRLGTVLLAGPAPSIA